MEKLNEGLFFTIVADCCFCYLLWDTFTKLQQRLRVSDITPMIIARVILQQFSCYHCKEIQQSHVQFNRWTKAIVLEAPPLSACLINEILGGGVLGESKILISKVSHTN